jgi:hypothetical protein
MGSTPRSIGALLREERGGRLIPSPCFAPVWVVRGAAVTPVISRWQSAASYARAQAVSNTYCRLQVADSRFWPKIFSVFQDSFSQICGGKIQGWLVSLFCEIVEVIPAGRAARTRVALESWALLNKAGFSKESFHLLTGSRRNFTILDFPPCKTGRETSIREQNLLNSKPISPGTSVAMLGVQQSQLRRSEGDERFGISRPRAKPA